MKRSPALCSEQKGNGRKGEEGKDRMCKNNSMKD